MLGFFHDPGGTLEVPGGKGALFTLISQAFYVSLSPGSRLLHLSNNFQDHVVDSFPNLAAWGSTVTLIMASNILDGETPEGLINLSKAFQTFRSMQTVMPLRGLQFSTF